jgi:hypothetical protein
MSTLFLVLIYAAIIFSLNPIAAWLLRRAQREEEKRKMWEILSRK